MMKPDANEYMLRHIEIDAKHIPEDMRQRIGDDDGTPMLRVSLTYSKTPRKGLYLHIYRTVKGNSFEVTAITDRIWNHTLFIAELPRKKDRDGFNCALFIDTQIDRIKELALSPAPDWKALEGELQEGWKATA